MTSDTDVHHSHVSLLGEAVMASPFVSLSTLSVANAQLCRLLRVRSVYRRILAYQTREHVDSPSFSLLCDRLRRRLLRLDYYVLIPPRPSDAVWSELRGWYREVRDRSAVLRLCGYVDVYERGQVFVDPVFEAAAHASLRMRSEALVFRIIEALSSSVVYPVFVTLTVDSEHDGVLSAGRRDFEFFLRRVRRRLGEFEYCAVTERGDLGRLHMHCLFLFEACSWLDPNFDRPGNNQLIPGLSDLWTFGFSDWVEVRYNPLDVYGSLGHRWPSGLRTSNAVAVATYMGAYLSKPSMELNGCRSRMTRGFGLAMIRQIMTPALAVALLSGQPLPGNLLSLFQSEPPRRLLVYMAARMLFGKAFPSRLPQIRLGSVSVASLTRRQRMSNPSRRGDSVNVVSVCKRDLDKFDPGFDGVNMGVFYD